MSYLLKLLMFVVSVFFAAVAHAASTTPDVTVLHTITDAMATSATELIGPMATGVMGLLVTVQFVFTNLRSLAKGAELPEVFAKLCATIMTVGVSYYVMKNGPGFIDAVGNSVFNDFLRDLPSASSIILVTIGLCSPLVAAIVLVGVIHTAAAQLLMLMLIMVFGIGIYLSMKVFMLYLELGMVVMMAPLSFAFLGMDALRDQGISPFKSLISLVFRAALLGVIYSAFAEVTQSVGASLSALSWTVPSSWPDALNTVLSALVAFPVIGFLVYKSDSIAAGLTSGSTSMGPADVAGAAAAGAAAGAAAMGAAGGATNLAKMPLPLPKFGGGEISNASRPGSGMDAPPPVNSVAPGGGSPAQSTEPPVMTVAERTAANNAFDKLHNIAPPSGAGASIGAQTPAAAPATMNGQRLGQKSAMDHLKDANHHMAQEKAAVHVSINTNGHD